MTTTHSAAGPSELAITDGYAWMYGEYVPISEARISVLDHGFSRGDLTWTAVAVWDGKFFRLEQHFERFERGCRTQRLEPPMSRDEMTAIAFEVVRRSGLRHAYVALILTRGIPTPGERDPRRIVPRFCCYAIPYLWIVRPEGQEIGTDIIVARDVRRTPPGAINPTVKSFQWGDFIRGIFEAYDRGAWLPILTDGDGHITEGAGFNVFAVKDGRLYTAGRGVLPGITRQTVIDIAAEEGIPVEMDDVPTGLLYGADEIFLTSTAGGVVPVANLDGKPVGEGRPGPTTLRIREKFWAWHDDPRFVTEVDYGE
jgi:branched-subunit amino acid aminotransferase/4-amino-4-deoxychorismate lyase